MYADQVDQYQSLYPELYLTDTAIIYVEDDEDMYEGETE